MGKVVENLEEDATNILQFLASNRLVANPSKTELILLNMKTSKEKRIIQVRTAKIEEAMSAKLLGITMDNDQKWTSHFWGNEKIT